MSRRRLRRAAVVVATASILGSLGVSPTSAAADASGEPAAAAAGQRVTGMVPAGAPIPVPGTAAAAAQQRRSNAAADDEPLTVQEAQRQARRQARPAPVGTPGFDVAAAAGPRVLREKFSPPPAPTADLVTECQTTSASTSEVGHMRNRFQWCARYDAYDYILDTRGRQTGFAFLSVIAVGYGRDDGERDITMFLRPESVYFGGSYTPVSTFGFEMECYRNTPGCSISGGKHSRSMAVWEAYKDTNTWVAWHLASDESVSTLQDQVLYHPFNFEVTAMDGRTMDGNNHYFTRCDSADYFLASRLKACIFHDVIPHLQYRMYEADGTRTTIYAVAEHIRDAFADPDSTYPLKPGERKSIPGRYGAPPTIPGQYLERVPYGGVVHTANGREKDRACNRTNPYQDTGLPTPPGDGEQCDEFPFASTQQGAANPNWDFSVRAVPEGDNSRAGIALREYYRDDRILYSENQPLEGWIDVFYVEVIESSGGSGGGTGEIDQAPVVNAGPNVTGDEGSQIQLRGTATDRESTPSLNWSYTAGDNVDAGATCRFADALDAQTTITCTDDGTFTVTLTADDGVNPPVSDSAIVTVYNVAPQVRLTGPDPWQLFKARTPVTVTATFTDPGANDTHTCRVDWDDTTTSHTAAAGHSCTVAHTFAHAGMYTLGLTVTDDDGGADIAGVMVVVYDPDDGWTNLDAATETPPGALAAANPTAWTWAHLTARYYTPNGPPTGEAKMWIPDVFRMEPTSRLEWLVVTPDGKVAAKGTSTTATGDTVGFVFYGYRGCPAAGPDCQPGPDRMRAVLWPTNTGQIPGTTITYDNRRGADYDIDRFQPAPLTSGSVQIHH